MKHTGCAETKSRVPPALQQGQERRLPLFCHLLRQDKRPNSRLGITTGLKLGNAVKRNRARRRIRESTAPMRAGFCRAMTLWWWPGPG